LSRVRAWCGMRQPPCCIAVRLCQAVGMSTVVSSLELLHLHVLPSCYSRTCHMRLCFWGNMAA
jgi:hypothetical protein